MKTTRTALAGVLLALAALVTAATAQAQNPKLTVDKDNILANDTVENTFTSSHKPDFKIDFSDQAMFAFRSWGITYWYGKGRGDEGLSWAITVRRGSASGSTLYYEGQINSDNDIVDIYISDYLPDGQYYYGIQYRDDKWERFRWRDGQGDETIISERGHLFTVDRTAPTVASWSPAVAHRRAPLVITFSETMYKNSAGGNPGNKDGTPSTTHLFSNDLAAAKAAFTVKNGNNNGPDITSFTVSVPTTGTNAQKQFILTPTADWPSNGVYVALNTDKLYDVAGLKPWATNNTFTTDTASPTVVAASSGYYSDANLSTQTAGPEKEDEDIYVKVTFSENVTHTAGDGASARPEISYKIGEASAERFDIVAHNTALASGDCRPNHATKTNVYACRYTVEDGDDGDFDFRVGTGTTDIPGNAMASAYTHAVKAIADTTRPTVTAASSGYYEDAALSKPISVAKVGADIYVKVTFSEDMTQSLTDSLGAGSEPNMGYRFGTGSHEGFDIVAHNTALTSGRCRPDEAAPADVYECRYTVGSGDSGNFGFWVGAGTTDLAGNGLYPVYYQASKVSIDKTAPTVTAAQSGYYTTHGLSTELKGPLGLGEEIYIKVTLSENVRHTADTDADARPEIAYKIGDAAEQQFHIITTAATLASGECEPDGPLPASVYACRYTTASGDNGDFDFRVGIGTQDLARNALAAKYTHTDKIVVDTTAPTYSSSTVNGNTLTVVFSETLASEKAANSAFTVTKGGSNVAVNSYTLSGATAVLTLASAVLKTDTVTVLYTRPAGANDKKLQDPVGNELATFSAAQTATNRTAHPTVVAASTGYFLDADHNTSLARAVNANTDIYMKVTFSENVKHVADTDADARPEIKYQIGSNTAQQFDIVAATAALASGECQPDAGTAADVYECLYTLTTNDSGSFELQVGIKTTADDDNAELEAAYTQATKLTIDNASPSPVPPTGSGYYSDANLSTRLTGPVKAGDNIYIKAEFTENLRHVPGAAADPFFPNPGLGYRITSLSNDQTFEIVASGTALAHGQCRPDATPPADDFECRYTVQSADRGEFGFLVFPGTYDVAGNTLPTNQTYAYPAKLAIDAPGPKVTAASSGYYQSDSFAKQLTGPVKADTKIYLKVTFSENVKHTANDGASARPEIDYKIGTAAAVQFDILAANATLGSGDCRPDGTTPADVYECLYTVVSGDNGNFDFTVDTGTQNTTNDPIDQAYTHTTKLAVDTTAPTFVASSSNVNGDTLTMTFSESLKNEKPAASAFAVTVAGSSRSVSSVALSGATATLTLASAVANDSLAVTVLYTNPGGTNAKLQDPAGNEVATFTTAQSVTNNTGTPYVLSASSGYYSDANLTKSLPGPVQGGKDIYAKITFNEDVTHTVGDGASARPEISYKIGTATAQQFDIVAPGTTLLTGDCRPDHATDRDTYECRYRTANSENADFDFRVGANTTDTDNNAFASTYIHLTKVTIDNTAPAVLAASSGYFSDDEHTTPIVSAAESGDDIYVKVAFNDIMSHTTGDGEDGRPYLAYTIGTASNIVPFDVLAHGAALASGDCRPAKATPSDVYECLYTVGASDSGSFDFRVGAGSEDAAGNGMPAIYRHATNLTLARAGLTVLAGQSDYYQADSFSTRLSGPVNSDTDIYLRVAFSENVGHTTSDSASARPEISYKIGSAAAVQFDILNTSSASLGSGDCRPDGAKPADGYECRYRVQSSDSGNFDFRVGTGTQDGDGKALPAAYTHAAKIEVDNTAPTVTAASSGYYTTDSFATELDGPVNSDSEIFVKVAFSEDVGHKTGGGSTARPELQYKIGDAAAQRFDIVAPGTALLTGDCRPDHATDRDTYECRYTPLATDGGAFAFVVGVGSEDVAGNALANAYTHTDKITIDNTAPRFRYARVNGSTLTMTLDETMGSEKAANSAFAITVGGNSRAVNSYSLSGARATLTLASAASQTDTVTVAYTKPGAADPKLKDEAATRWRLSR